MLSTSTALPRGIYTVTGPDGSTYLLAVTSAGVLAGPAFALERDCPRWRAAARSAKAMLLDYLDPAPAERPALRLIES